MHHNQFLSLDGPDGPPKTVGAEVQGGLVALHEKQ